MDAILAQREEATGSADTFGFVFKGERWTAKHPLLADDDWNDELQDMQETIDVAAHYMGAEQWDKFVAAGGFAGIVIFAVREEGKRMAGEVDGRPTRSSTSSAKRRKR